MGEWEKTKKEDWSLSFFMKGLKTLWQLMYDEKKHIIVVITLVIFISTLRLIFPYIFKIVFDKIYFIEGQKKLSKDIIWIIAGMGGLGVFILFFNHFIKEIFFIKSIITLKNLWPVAAQEKLLALSLGYHEQENTGKKISKINKGCEKLVDIMCNIFWNFLPHLFYLCINAIFILAMDWKLGLIFFSPLVLAGLLNLKIHTLFADDWDEWERQKEVSMGLFCQSILNIQTVQNYVQEEREKYNLRAVRKKMEKLDIDVNIRLHKYFFFIGLIFHISFTMTFAFGIYFVLTGTSTPGTIIYIITTGNVTIQSLSELINIFI